MYLLDCLRRGPFHTKHELRTLRKQFSKYNVPFHFFTQYWFQKENGAFLFWASLGGRGSFGGGWRMGRWWRRRGTFFPSLFLFLFLFFSIIFLFSSRFLFLFFGILFVGFLVFFRFVILACSFFLLVFFFCFPEFSFLFFCVSNTRALPCLMLMFFFAIPKSSESLTAKPSSRQRYVGRNLRFRRIEALHFATMTHNQNSRRDFKPHFQ